MHAVPGISASIFKIIADGERKSDNRRFMKNIFKPVAAKIFHAYEEVFI
jgi:hypothetical protein